MTKKLMKYHCKEYAMKIMLLRVVIFLIGYTGVYAQHNSDTDYYLSGIIPDSIPFIFGKGIVSTKYFEHSSPAFSKDGKEMLWTVIPGAPGTEAFIFSSKREDEGWSVPEKVTYLGNNDDMYPVFAFDFQRIYFSSAKSPTDKQEPVKRSIWYVNKTGNGYADPVYIGFDFLDIFGLFVAKSGNLYFMAQNLNNPDKYNLYFSQYTNATYAEPKLFPEPINSENYEDNPFLFDDETYMIFESSRPGGYGAIDLYISAREEDGSWSLPINIGEPINSEFSDRFPKISTDGKYFFWGSNRNAKVNKYDFDVYWISTSYMYNLIKR